MGQSTSQPHAVAPFPKRSKICEHSVIKLLEDPSRDTSEELPPCFAIRVPFVGSCNKTALGLLKQGSCEENNENFVAEVDFEWPRRQTRPLHHCCKDDVSVHKSPLVPQGSIKAMQSVDSTMSINSWSLNSMATGSVGSSTALRKSRQIDVYQTDSTLVMDEELDDWGPLVFRSGQSRLKLPFRTCHRRQCFCNAHRKKCSTLIPPLLTKKEDQLLNSSSAGHRRDGSDELQGLWIPVGELTEEQEYHTKRDSTKREFKWMKNSHSERHLRAHHGNDSDASLFLPEISVRQRSHDVSHDQQKQLPRMSPPLFDDSDSHVVSGSQIFKAAPVLAMSSVCSSESETSNGWSSRSSTTESRQSMKSGLQSPCRKVDDTHFATKNCMKYTCSSFIDVPATFPRSNDLPVRQRMRSEDVVDQRSNTALSDQPTEWAVEPPVSDDASLCSSSSRCRTYANDIVRKTKPCKLKSHECLNPSIIPKTVPCSPISVLSFQGLVDSSMTPAVPRILSPVETHYESTVKAYRATIEQLKRTRSALARLKIIHLYHAIACLHLQHQRPNAALCVIDHALDRLFLSHFHQKSRCPCLTLEDTVNSMDTETKPLLAELLVTKATIMLFDAEEAKNGASESRATREAKDLAKTALSLLGATSQEAAHLLLIKAKGLSILARAYSSKAQSPSKARPNLALEYVNRALAILRFLAEKDPSILHTTLIAEACLHIGTLCIDNRSLSMAKGALWESLHIFRYLHQLYEGATNCTVQDDSQRISLGMVSTLANLGWTHLLENGLDLAQQSTMEALWFLEAHDGRVSSSPPHWQILAALEFQLGMIASQRGQTTLALACWHTCLSHQQEPFHPNQRDIAVSLEAIGSAYQQLDDWPNARSFLERALEIRRQSKDYLIVARIQSRLAVVLLDLNEVHRAEQLLTKASITYKKLGIPMEDYGQKAAQRLSILHEDRLNS